MKRSLLCGAAACVAMMVAASNAQALDTLSASASATDDDGDAYGFSFTITRDPSDSTIFSAVLENTSDTPSEGAEPLIDQFAFNLGADLDTDFFITNVVPSDWTIGDSSGGVDFDYVGDEGSASPDTRLGIGDQLTFDFDFVDTFDFPANPFDLWLDAETDAGKGFGGGDDTGQVAVRFQQLDNFGAISPGREACSDGDGQCSDLLAANWVFEDDPDDPDEQDVPEPATLALIGSGLLAAGLIGRRRRTV